MELISFDEYMRSLFDYDGNGTIDKGRETRAYNKAMKAKNVGTYRQAYAEYVALVEAANKNERSQEQAQAALAAQQALVQAAGEGNEAAEALITGKTKGDEIKSIVVVGAVALVAVIFLIFRKK